MEDLLGAAAEARRGHLHLQTLLSEGRRHHSRRMPRRSPPSCWPTTSSSSGRYLTTGQWDPDIGHRVHHSQGDARPQPEVTTLPHRQRRDPDPDQRRAQPGPEPQGHPHHPGLFSEPGGSAAAPAGWACPTPPMWNWNTSPRPAATTATTTPFRACFTTGTWSTGQNGDHRQPLQDLHRRPDPGPEGAKALGGVGAVGQCRRGAVRRRITTM